MDDTVSIDAHDIEDLLFSSHPYTPVDQPTPVFGTGESGETQEFSLESMLDFDFGLE
ncbi:MAG: hypothetical protein ACWA5X_04915 [bacterium]